MNNAFRRALLGAGLAFSGPILADGKLHRFKVEDDHQPNSWFVLFCGPPAAGAFGCWKRGIKETWCESSSLSQIEWNDVRRRWLEAERERERAEIDRWERAQRTAARIMARSKHAKAHAYLAAKGVKAHGELLRYRDALALPLRDSQGQLHSLQFIGVDGAKRFLTGGRIAGTFFQIENRPHSTLVICEGYATGASIHEATGYSTACAMNCGNLLTVTKALGKKWPGRQIIIAADNDEKTPGNPGVTKAIEAALAVKARLAVPHFGDASGKPTDFNDLHQLQGLAIVKDQIENAGVPEETDDQSFERLANLPPAQYDRCRENEAKRLKIRVATLDGEVSKRRPTSDTGPQGNVTLRTVEPWPDPVNGAELLNDIAAFYERFVVLPLNAAYVLAVWCLQTWCYERFDFAAIIAIWSPEHECGKGRVLDVTEKIVRRPFRTSNTSVAVLYHVISKGNLTVLVDELDSISDEQRDAICNIFKGGFQSNGTAHRMTERNGEQVEIEFRTFCPKMIATITLDKLDKPTRSRTIGIRMQRKPRSQKVEKFRRVDGTVLQRKCMRWAQDNTEAISHVPPMNVDECATDRQEDVWEPLVAVAQVAGGVWEKRIRLAARQLTGNSDGASETVAHRLLAAFQSFFAEDGDRADTKTIIVKLNEAEDFSDVNYGRGLTPQYVAKLLKPYGIEPRVHKMKDGKPARGYSREDCEQAFTTYLSNAHPKDQLDKCNSVTVPENTGKNVVLENVTGNGSYISENAVLAHKNAGGYGVTDQKLDLAEADLL
jgi:putative DNA primase/helicase